MKTLISIFGLELILKNLNMKNIFLLLLCYCSFICCKKHKELKISQFNETEIIKMETDTVKSIANEKYYELGKELLDECFVTPSNIDFENKIKEIFSREINLKNQPELILGEHEDSEIALKGYNYIIPSFYNFQYGESEKDVSIKIYKEIGLDKELCKYNNMIFYNNSAATSYIKKHTPFLLINLATKYGYTDNKNWLKFAFSKSKLNEPDVLESFLFDVECRGEWRGESGDCNTISTLRKDMLNKMIEYGAELSQLHLVANMVANGNQEMYKEDKEEIYNYLMAHCYAAGQSGMIEYLYDTNPKIKEVFKKNNYYGVEGLAEYTNETYLPKDKRFGIGSSDPDPYDGYGVINDPDGYTNMREGKGTSHPVVRKVLEGEKFAIERKEKEWWLIVLADGTKGWIHKSRIKIISE